MKKFLVLFPAIIFLFVTAQSQPYLKSSMLSAGGQVTLGEVQKSFDHYWESRDPDLFHEEENAEEGGYQQFQRAAAFMKQRSYPSGKLLNPEILYQEY